jgi:WD40 repeat protein
MSGTPELSEAGDLSAARRVDAACVRFEAAWAAGQRPRIEDFLDVAAEAERPALLRELLHLELEYRRRGGDDVDPHEYRARFPLHTSLLEQVLSAASGPLSPATPQTVRGGERLSATPDGPAVPGYEVYEVLGRGGMGVVYKARQTALNRVVALKMILHAEYAGTDERQRFQTEAEVVARLQHPHVVQIYEVGAAAGVPYFSLEYCGGGSLADQLDGTPWQAKPAARLVEVLAGAVDAAHRVGVVHRDLKPGNVLLAVSDRSADNVSLRDGGAESTPLSERPLTEWVPKVTDFGLAKRLDAQPLTQTGAVVGTPSYMAPEQAGGRKDVGPAADVYALGAILYELLTGRPPFRAATPLDTVLQVLSEEPVALRRLQPKVPKDLETVCHKCLEKDPKRRYSSAAALAEDLRRFGAGEPVAARPVGVVGRLAKWGRRRPAVALLLAAVALVAAAGLVGILWAYGEAVVQRQAARAETLRAEEQAADARWQKGRADEQAERAEQKAAEATREAKEARWQEYLAQIGRAEAQLGAHDHAAAAEALDRIGPEYHRRWEYGYLRRQAEGTLLTLRGHTLGATAVAYSPDGSRLASGSHDWTIKLWDARSGALIATLRGHTASVWSVAYSPDGTRLASASMDKTIKLWDCGSGALLATLRGHTGAVRSVVYSPDGRRLASAGGEWLKGEVKVWDAHSGAAIATLRGHTNRVFSVAYSPDGTRLATASEDQTVKVWDAGSGALIATLRGQTSIITSVAYSPDGTRLAGGASDNKTINLWDAKTGALITTLRGHTDRVLGVRFSPDGKHLASAGWDRTVKVWDAHRGALVATLGHRRMWSVCYSPDGTRLASSSQDFTVKVWDTLGDGTPLAGDTHSAQAVAYSPDGTRLAGATANGVKLGDAKSGAPLATLPGYPNGVLAVCYSPDGTRLAGASLDHTILVWDSRTGTLLALLRGHTFPVRSLAFSPDGSRLASAGPDGVLKLWGARSGAEIATLRGHAAQVWSVVYSPDGTRLASASEDKTVKLWDGRSGADLATLRGHTSAVFAVAYSPDGTHLASASWDRTVKLWDATRGAELATLRGHTDPVNSVVYSPDGTRIVSASFDKTVKVWDAKRGALIATLRGHTAPVHSVVHSPDGTRLASAATESGYAGSKGNEPPELKLWDARSPAPAATLRGHPDALIAVSYSADGTRLVSTDVSGSTLVWDAATGKLLPGEPPPPRLAEDNVSPDGATVAVPTGNLLCLWPRRPTAGAYDPWAEDLNRRKVLAPAWHAQEAAAAAKAGNAFAAAFHRRRLAEGDNLRLLAWSSFAAGDEPGCRQAIDALRQQHRLLAALAPAGALVAVLAAPTTPGQLTAATAAPLGEREQRRLAAQLVRAAAVLADRGVPAAELVALARAGVAAEPESWQARELLGAALYRNGQVREAVAELEEAVRRHGEGGSLWARLFLALAQRRLGDAEKAQHYRRQALAPGDWEPSFLQMHLLGELDDPLPEVLAGRARPTSAAHAAVLAWRCIRSKGLYAAGARLYEEAFAADPRLLDAALGHRYDAARAAARAAAGQGPDAATLGQPERARLRQLAHDWLRAELGHWTKILQAGRPEDRNAALQKMQYWQYDSDLAGVRDKRALAALPEAERQSWEQLWTDVAALLDRARQGK